MDRRSWPWRKKSSVKVEKLPSFDSRPNILSPALSFEAYEEPPSRVYVEQESPQVQVQNARELEAVSQREQAEEKVKNLTERLTTALSEMTAKEDLVKQHAKVAEEAVSGWEKAEAEALSFKQELEASIQQKKVVEDRVAHLDGALKECMRQVRHARDEQEQKIQEAILRKTREWDKIKAELEAKQAELGLRCMESEAENSAISRSLQERARTIMEVTEGKAKAETEVKVLQVRLDTLEKEISALKYELHVLNKELEIRNEEREYTRKAADAAHRQHLESVKKIAKLESECQRLRILIRKKLPGPAAVAQMRMEVEGLGREFGETKRRKSFNKSAPTTTEVHQQESLNAAREIEMLTDRLLAMDEETKLLKEALTKRNGELQAARQMCARTVNKLSVAEDHLESLQGTPKASRNGIDFQNEALPSVVVCKEPSVASRSEEDGGNEEEVSCAESWASALITELAHFKKDKATHGSRQSMESCNFDTIDDFLEIERQASATPRAHSTAEGTTVRENQEQAQNCLPDRSRTLKTLANKESELQAANLMCKDVSCKLSLVEEQLRALKSENTENEATMAQVQESLSCLVEAHQKVSKLDRVLDEVRIAVASTDESDCEENADTGGTSTEIHAADGVTTAPPPPPPGQSREAAATIAHVGRDQSCNSIPVASLSFVLCKIILLLEVLAPLQGQNPVDQGDVQPPASHPESQDQSPKSECLTRVHVEKKMQGLLATKEKLLQGKANVLEFLLHLAAVLSCLCSLDSSEMESMLLELSSSNRNEESGKLGAGEGQEPQQEALLANANNPVSQGETQTSEEPTATSMEQSSLLSLQKELEQVKEEKAQVERNLGSINEELQLTKAHLADSKQLATDLQAQITSLQEAKEKAERDRADETVMKTDLEARFKNAENEVGKLQDSIASLQAELAEHRKQYQDAVVRCESFEQQLQGMMKASNQAAAAGPPKEHEQTNSHRSTDDEEARLRKEREVAAAKEKLAECQRTILVLGKQLTALTSPRHSPEASFDSSMDSSALSMDQRIVPMVPNAAVEHVPSIMEEMQASHDARYTVNRGQFDRRRGNSGAVAWSRSDRRFDNDTRWSPSMGGYVAASIDSDHYLSQQQQPQQQHHHHHHQHHRGPPVYSAPQYNGRQILPDGYNSSCSKYNGGGGVHSPLENDYHEGSALMYSPPDTAMSSPARSPARYLGGRRSSGNAVRTNLTKSMNRAAASSSVKPVKPGSSSSFSRFFSRSKNHR